MKKNLNGHFFLSKEKWLKSYWLMRNFIILFFVLNLSAMANGLSQQVSMARYENASLIEVFDDLKAQTGFGILYKDSEINPDLRVSMIEENSTIQDVLDFALQGTKLSYRIQDDVIVIYKAKETVLPLNETKQEKNEIKGTVKDADGNTLPGVSVVVKGTTTGVATDIDGNYTIKFDGDNAVLVYSFVGMISQDIVYKGQIVQNVVLSADAAQMDEVIVTGYQTISKERATGSYVVLDSKALDDRPVVNVSSALTGLVPGMVKSGDSFIIRGLGTLKGNSQPLVVIDGFAVDNTDVSHIDNVVDATGGAGRDPFASLNPDDIENINVLKDAAATSIWGARASNGVIVITTKKGNKSGDMAVSVNSFVSVSDKIDLDYAFNMVDAKTHIEYEQSLATLFPAGYNPERSRYQNKINTRFRFSKSLENLIERDNGNITEEQYNRLTDNLIANNGIYKDQYQKYLMRHAVTQNHNFSISGTSNKNTYKFSALYARNTTSFKYNSNNKLLLNFSEIYKYNDRLNFSVGINTHIEHNKNNGTNISQLKGMTAPYTSLFDENGDYANMNYGNGVYEPFLKNGDVDASLFRYNWRANILEDVKTRDKTTDVLNLRLQGKINYKILDGLKFTSSFQYENNRTSYENIDNEESLTYRISANTYSSFDALTGRYKTNLKGDAFINGGGSHKQTYNVRNVLSYNKTFADLHQVNVLLGTEVSSSTIRISPSFTKPYNEYTLASPAYDYRSHRFKNFDDGKTAGSFFRLGNRKLYEDRYFSNFVNFMYTFNEKYTATVSFRTDASNFVAESVSQKFSPFWSVGLSWHMKDDLFKKTDFLDKLTLRGTLGIAGLAAGKRSETTKQTLSILSGDGVNLPIDESYGLLVNRGNPSLTWEKSSTVNLGVDFAFLSHKLWGSLEYYSKRTTDVLSRVDVSYLNQGQSRLTINDGELLNRGIEFSLNSRLKVIKNVFWSGMLTFAYNHNEVVEFNRSLDGIGSVLRGGDFLVKGRPLDHMYAYNVSGYNDNGLLILEDNKGVSHVVDQDFVREFSSNQLFKTARKGLKDEDADNNPYIKYQGRRRAPVNMSLKNSLTGFGFTLSAQIDGYFGHKFRRNDYAFSYKVGENYSTHLLNAWQSGDDKSHFSYMPLPTAANASNLQNLIDTNSGLVANSSAIIEDASHIRLNQIYLGYDIPKNMLKRMGLNKLRLYTQVRNLGVLWAANKKGIDPVYQRGSVKPPKVYTFGLKVNF